MGESKRRKEVMGEKYGSTEPVASWIPFLTKNKAAKFVEVSTQFAWYGIGEMVVIWKRFGLLVLPLVGGNLPINL